MLAAAAIAAPAYSQEVQKLDPALDQIVSPGTKAEKVVSGFNKWTEGPAWTRQGSLIFAEIPANNIDLWIPGKGSQVFIHPSGYEGSDAYGGPEPGSNGMTLDPKGRVTVAGHARRNVWRLEALDPKGQITVLADAYEGKKLNSPNDVVYKSDGSLYFTDPPYGLRTQGDDDPAKEQKLNGVFRIVDATKQKPGAPPDHTKIQLIIKDLPRPNGIAFSPDEKILYIADSGKHVWLKYPVNADGSVGEGSRSSSMRTSTKLRAAPTAFAWTKMATSTARAPAASGFSRPKASTWARSKFPRLSAMSPGATPTEKRSTSRGARASIASS